MQPPEIENPPPRSGDGCRAKPCLLDGDAAGGGSVLLADHAAQHGLGVGDQSVLQSHAGLVAGLGEGISEYVVGVAASSGEVVGGDGVLGISGPGFAAKSQV